MDASKVVVSRETRETLNNPMLTMKKRRQLKEERIKAYIRSRPHGEAQLAELAAAAGYDVRDDKSYNAGWAFVTGMIKRGSIIKSDGSDRKNSYVKQWTIPGDVKATVEKRQPTLKEIDALTPAAVEGSMEKRQQVIARSSLVESAKEFAWKYNSDSLRDFVKYVENA